MAFNSDTYRMNKALRESKEYLERARDLKARHNRGEAYSWEMDGLPSLVKLARISMREYRGWRRLKAISERRAA